MVMDGLTIFGMASVITMLIAYALEDKSHWWIFVFAITCIASSIYGWMAGTIPFGIIEIVWAVVAFNRWQKRRKGKHINNPAL